MTKHLSHYCILLPKMSGYVKCFDENMSFLIKDHELLEKTYKKN